VAAFLLITLGVLLRQRTASARVIRPQILFQIHRSGWRLMPLAGFMAFVLGLVVVGQAIDLLNRVGAREFIGPVMITAVVRELGPLVVALLALARVGTVYVIELGTARALGEVDALESLAIDPIHYLVVPRVVGLSLSVFALTIYFILLTLLGGYSFAFVQNVALAPAEFLRQLTVALTWQDFVLLGLKTAGFGSLIAAVTCYQGLARPLRLEDLSTATTRAVVQSVAGCLVLDLAFIAGHFWL
jgi:phospholipid/cholesterol/gamma-HCH transport system permease protein